MTDFIKFISKVSLLCGFSFVVFSFSMITYKKIEPRFFKEVQINQLLKAQIKSIADFTNADFTNIFKLWVRNSAMLLLMFYSLKLTRDELNTSQNILNCIKTVKAILVGIPIVIGILLGFLNVKLYYTIGNSFVNMCYITLSMVTFHGIFELMAYITFIYKSFYKIYRKALISEQPMDLINYVSNSWNSYYKIVVMCLILLAIAAYIEIQGLNAAWIYINHCPNLNKIL